MPPSSTARTWQAEACLVTLANTKLYQGSLSEESRCSVSRRGARQAGLDPSTSEMTHLVIITPEHLLGTIGRGD